MVGITWSEADAEQASFLAILPPTEVVVRVQDLQAAVGVDASTIPHITVKAQPGLEDPAKWRDAVAETVAKLVPITVDLPGVGWFGDGIVFLTVSDSVRRVHRYVLAAVEDVNPTAARFEYDGPGYEPHLTLAATFAGARPNQLHDIAEAAAELVWPSFVAHEVVELRRTGRDRGYRPVRSYPMLAR